MGRVGEYLSDSRRRVKRRAVICCSVLIMAGMLLSMSGCGNVDLKNFIELMTEQFNNPYIKWVKAYGGSGTDLVFSVQSAHGSGYIFAGYTDSFLIPMSAAWIVKVNDEGVIQWQRSYGGNVNDDYAHDIDGTTDGGYIVAVTRDNNVGLVKLTGNGSVTWAKTYFETDMLATWTLSVEQTSDSGYVLCGTTEFVNFGESFLMVWKFDQNGLPQWRTKIGAASEEGYSIQQTSDGGYIVAGLSWSQAEYGGWVIKLKSDGTIDWQYVYGGSYLIYDIVQTSDGGYVCAGQDYSIDADGDLWVLKLNSNGTIKWQKRYGKLGPIEMAWSIQQTPDNGYIIAGDRCPSALPQDYDFWVLRLDPDGGILWQKSYGGMKEDRVYDIQQTEDGGFIVVGNTFSFGSGFMEDILVLKLDGDGNPVFTSSDRMFGVDTDAQAQNTSSFRTSISVPGGVDVTTVSFNESFPVLETTGVETVLVVPTR